MVAVNTLTRQSHKPCHKHLSFLLIPFKLHNYSCVDHMTMIIPSCSSLFISFQPSTLSMPITFRSYLIIISDHLSYCPMLLSFILPSQPLIYLIIFIPLTFCLIILHSTLFLLDIPLHFLALSLIVIPMKF